MKRIGYHHIPFTRELWAKWLARLNTPPSQTLSDGIAEFRLLLSQPRHPRKRG